jgi:hypothetical protein
MVWISNWSWLLLIFPLLLILLLFPNGQPPTPRWRWVSVAAFVWAALFVLMSTLGQQLTTPNDLAFDNPIGVLREDTVELLAGMWIVGLLTLVVVCAVALFIRYRRTNDTERKQIKWLLYACAVFLVVYIGYIGGSASRLIDESSTGGYIWEVFLGVSLLTFPVAIGIAILRYRLYEIDVIINRTLVYGPLTGALVMVYFGGVAATQAVLQTFTGQQEQPQLAIVVSTLVIAALFNPLRRRIQGFIDRSFYRRKYDARKTLETFSAKLRDETDLEALNAELVGVVRDTMQPAHVSMWLRPETAQKGERAS